MLDEMITAALERRAAALAEEEARKRAEEEARKVLLMEQQRGAIAEYLGADFLDIGEITISPHTGRAYLLFVYRGQVMGLCYEESVSRGLRQFAIEMRVEGSRVCAREARIEPYRSAQAANRDQVLCAIADLTGGAL